MSNGSIISQSSHGRRSRDNSDISSTGGPYTSAVSINGSYSSVRSAYSISRAKSRQSARKAALLARAAVLKQALKAQLEEFNLKKEIAVAEAKERAYNAAQCELNGEFAPYSAHTQTAQRL
ncbi:hypothetical protein SNE40_018125 [Patella caerulea]|uniref:Uncharacterized protein n=1 Tax=Patella caerulea TaxID=87958 RepID=A0AAN8JA42_PATCE